MLKIKIDGQDFQVEEGLTVLQAVSQIGKEIPVFCYHDRLAIAGNCRMCLVEVENTPKPVASCAMPVTNGMSVRTSSDMVRKARKGVLELLLINHPLDCPICDQGGECDLQDITMAYGPSTSRFRENKRAVTDKPMGPLVKTAMTRCIHCTRCVRFITDVAGVPDIGTINRGEDMEITSYLDRAISSELSGNIVDLCPVGALTSKPYAYRGRPWELDKTESIDVMDALGSAIRIDTHNMQVMRILPRINEDINEEWLSDKSRYACDALSKQRLDQPYVRNASGRLQPASWVKALSIVAERINKTSGHQIAAISGDFIDVEAMVVLKDLLDHKHGVHLECRQDGAFLDPSCRASYIFNTTIAGIEQADLCLTIGTNLRQEAPLVAARLRKAYLNNGLKIASLDGLVAQYQRLTIPFEDLGDDLHILDAILTSHHPFSKTLKSAQKPMLIVGQNILKRSDAPVILYKIRKLAEQFSFIQPNWNGFNVLHQAASRVGALDIGFYPDDPQKQTMATLYQRLKAKEIKLVYLLGADEVDTDAFKDAFVIYQGHHGDRGAHCADVVLPGAAYTEKNATYVNTEGRPQHAYAALAPPGQAQEDWRILCQLAEVLSQYLPYQTLDQIRARMIEINPIFEHTDQITSAEWQDFGHDGFLNTDKIMSSDPHFYMTDSISRHSPTMALCRDQIEQPALKAYQS